MDPMSLLQKINVLDKIAPSRAALGLALSAICALAVLTISTSLWASTVLKLDLESLVANSDQIVEGKVTQVNSKVENGKVFTYTEVQVEEGMKGAQTGETVTIKQLGGRTEELATWVPGVPHFQSGERIIVFLEKSTPKELPVVTGMSQGKFQVSLGPDNVTPYVVPFLGDLGLVEPIQELEAGGALELGEAPKQGQQGAQYQPARPDDLYQRVVPLDVFKQNVREVIRGQGEE
jgi:hypothetical protein